jgi:hypothetical protein
VTFSLTIDTDNAAFQDGQASQEVARILAQLADKLQRGAFADDLREADGAKLRDVNGNTVGSVQVER